MLLSTLFLFLENPGTIIFIVCILMLFFGAKRIPELFRGLGQGMKEFKDATRPDAPATPHYQAPQPGYGAPQGYQPAPPPAYDPNAYPAQPGQAPVAGGYPAQPQQPYAPLAPGQVPPAPYPTPAGTPAN